MKKRLPWFLGLILILFVNFIATAQVPERKGWWKFDDPSTLLKAQVGSDLELVGSSQSVDGPIAGNKAILINVGDYLVMNHGISSNGGGSTVNEYSLQIDFSVPETGIWHSFIQTDPTNGGDADLFTNTSNAIGVSEAGYSAKGISANTWYRMILTVKNGEFFKVYIDGVLWMDGAGRDLDGRFGLLSSLLLFADNDGEDGAIQCSEAAIWDVALGADDVASLGGPTGERVPVRTKLGWWKFDDPANLLKAEIGSPLELVGTQQSVDGPSDGNKATKIDVGSYLKMTDGILPNGGGAMVNEYSVQIDFSVSETSIWHAFMQTDVTNASDADLFINKTGNIGTAVTNYSTNAITAKTWYRMIVTVKNGSFYKVYINGELWLNGTAQAVDGRFALADKLLLFADEDGDDGSILCSEISVWEVALTEAEITELGGDPAVQIPDRAGWWKFDDPSDMLKAQIGNDLGETGSNSSVSGPAVGNNAIEVGAGSYLTMKHGVFGNGDGAMVNDYSLQIDFSVPETTIWHAFFQTDKGNSNDADLFINKTGNIGTATTSYTANAVAPNTWYRMVVTVKNGSFFRVYIDGELWLDASGQTVDGRFALADALLLFGDDDGDDGTIDCSEVSFWDVALNAEQVSKFGNATTNVTGIISNKISGDETGLGQNFPNPFSQFTTFPYQMQKASDVSFRILDLSGKEIRRIEEGMKSPGKYNLEISSEKLKNGIYFLQMKSNQNTVTRKMIVVQ
jgi:hypothetical protein